VNLSHNLQQYLKIAKKTMEIESQAILSASERIDGNITKAAEIILSHEGKVIVSGIGKSGIIGQKITATLCSTGTPAVFLHPTEAIHGNLGIYSPGDPSILISKSGSTDELLKLIPILRQFKSKMIAIVGNLDSVLGREADIVLDAKVDYEADPLGIVPTSSTVVALALGDALASTLMLAREFTEVDFSKFHPGGQLGRNLYLHVEDVMHCGEKVAWVQSDTSLRDIVIVMTSKPLGAACVINEEHDLLGIITDGDIRRALQKFDDIRPLKARDVMTTNPIFATPDITLGKAAEIMENRQYQISVLPVLEVLTQKCLGLIRLHDIYLGKS
jgi:arabinose-5-phosphate isomerase